MSAMGKRGLAREEGREGGNSEKRPGQDLALRQSGPGVGGDQK